MKLTSKSLFAVSVAGLFAGAAMANTDYVYDTFETDQTWTSTYDWWATGSYDTGWTLTPTNGMALTGFRRQLEIGNVTIAPWSSSGNSDQSIITNAAVDFSAAAARATGANTSVPGTNGLVGASTSQQYVVLDTQGDTVSRSFTSTTLSDTPLYVDTMIQFTASEDFTSTGLTGAKLALWVNKNTTEQFAAGDLIVYAQVVNMQTYETETGNYVIANSIDPEKWYRLTIEMKALYGMSMFCVRLDGVLLTNPDAIDIEDGNGNCWFYVLGDAGTYSVSEVAFQGTGAIDNLVVSDYEPSFAASAGALITLTWGAGDGIASVMLGGETPAALATGDTVGVGDTVTITTADWHGYYATNLTDWATAAAAYGTPGTITVTPEGATENIKTVTFTIASVTQAGTVALPAAGLYGTGTITAGTETVDAAKAAAWATAQNVTEAGFASVYSQYLLNIDATATDPALVISAIEKTSNGLKITVKKAYTAANDSDETIADLGTVNGTVYYRAADTLADLATAQDTAATVVVPQGTNDATIEITTSDDAQFVKVWVK